MFDFGVLVPATVLSSNPEPRTSNSAPNPEHEPGSENLEE
jgi:hypothetical protein